MTFFNPPASSEGAIRLNDRMIATVITAMSGPDHARAAKLRAALSERFDRLAWPGTPMASVAHIIIAEKLREIRTMRRAGRTARLVGERELGRILDLPYQREISPSDEGEGYLITYPEIPIYGITDGDIDVAVDFAETMLRHYANRHLRSGRPMPLPIRCSDRLDAMRQEWAADKVTA